MPHPATWHVVWRTDLDAEQAATAEEAAVRARLHQRPGTSAVVFEVTAPDGTTTEVDLGTQADQVEPAALAAAAVTRWVEDPPPGTPNPRAELRDALAAVDAIDGADLDDTELGNAWAEACLRLADRASRLLAWMEDNDVDPGDPPLCGCGGYHWTCSADDAGDGAPCDHEHGSTTYLRPLPGGVDVFEDVCDTCGATLSRHTLAQLEAAAPGFTAASTRVGKTSLPTAVEVDGTVIAVTRHIDLHPEEG